mmetsp:Transcript_28799/g.79355  ORF Transcript_28799/g.79355 Transcript_28799/m.79355 type:complete len:218 (-) Transcript_28799:164-817(-)
MGFGVLLGDFHIELGNETFQSRPAALELAQLALEKLLHIGRIIEFALDVGLQLALALDRGLHGHRPHVLLSLVLAVELQQQLLDFRLPQFQLTHKAFGFVPFLGEPVLRVACRRVFHLWPRNLDSAGLLIRQLDRFAIHSWLLRAVQRQRLLHRCLVLEIYVAEATAHVVLAVDDQPHLLDLTIVCKEEVPEQQLLFDVVLRLAINVVGHARDRPPG